MKSTKQIGVDNDSFMRGLHKTKSIQKLAAAQAFNQEFDKYNHCLSTDQLFDIINLVKSDKYNTALYMLYKAHWTNNESNKNTINTDGNNS